MQNTYQSYRRSEGFRERGATRGGAGLFKWDDVRNNTHRSSYLGQTVKLNDRWYEREDLKKSGKKMVDFDKLKAEKIAIRNREKQILDQCLQLGTSLPRIEEITHSLYVSDVSSVLKDKEEVESRKGLGYDQKEQLRRISKKMKTKKKKKKKKSGSVSSSSSSSSSSSDEEEKERKRNRRERRRRKKEEKKRKKRERRKKRKEKKEDRRRKKKRKRGIDDIQKGEDTEYRILKKRKLD